MKRQAVDKQSDAQCHRLKLEKGDPPMSLPTEKAKVLHEIDLIPEDRLPDTYNLLHHFRLSLEASQESIRPAMQFAGCWRDMTDEVFAEFNQEIFERRQRAFTRRRHSEAIAD